VDVVESAEDSAAPPLPKQLDGILESMITVEVIYYAILEQDCNENESHKSPLRTTLRKPFKVELLGDFL
jgi:hypothetical protein